MEEEAPGLEYLCGTMIELPRAALRADEIAEVADFFSFGTNDLTQTTLGMSRDDAEGKFLTFYLEDGVLERNPFEVLDQDGVGDLMRIGVERGRKTKPDIKLGICGEHGGEPSSVEFCHQIGLDYVSCSPYRVPLARLAAAQAVLKEAKRGQYVQAGGALAARSGPSDERAVRVLHAFSGVVRPVVEADSHGVVDVDEFSPDRDGNREAHEVARGTRTRTGPSSCRCEPRGA